MILLCYILLLPFCFAWAARLVRHDEHFTPDVVLRVTAKEIPIACTTRFTVVINETTPGPLIVLNEGEVTWIRVYNDITGQNLTMHWHGLSQSAAPFSDGSPMASQWPIPPGHFFDYEVLPQYGEAGTYFYHSHVGFEAVSATGPLIVRDPHDSPYLYDEERIIVLTDYFNKSDAQVEQGLTSNPFIWSGETEAILVNGQGTINNSTSGAPSCSLASLKVEPSKTYRFRIIGSTALSFVSMAFEGHDMTIIEADGGYTQPLPVTHLQVGVGQRYSVLVRTKSAQELCAEGRMRFFLQLESRERPTLTRSYAVFEYPREKYDNIQPPEIPPIELPTTTYNWVDDDLSALFPNDFPSLVNVTRRAKWGPLDETFPQTPYLVALYQNNEVALPSYDVAIANGLGIDPRVRAFPAKIGEVLEIVIQNSGSTTGGLDVHPFHSHGLHFYDIGSGPGTYNVTENEALLAFRRPIKRDTTMLYRYSTTAPTGQDAGWRAWRVRVTDPGVWMIHCHTLQHMIMGMYLVSLPALGSPEPNISS
ncbi:Multicopper oxidase [Penicillium mononematosum]|uniref:Multicopper oxidase n=1 Tax=Penicillium mononematosum TaxID=268346 RepID=UPI0025494565|nr:Multicopper oxidase [Penicillium mononematosum]KAJ6183729.1 Multicopper oxidase [Penicillium mononematosum]